MNATYAIEFATDLTVNDLGALRSAAIRRLRGASDDPESSLSRSAGMIFADPSGVTAICVLAGYSAVEGLPGVRFLGARPLARLRDDGRIEATVIFTVAVDSLPALLAEAVASSEDVPGSIRKLYGDPDASEAAMRALVRITEDRDPFEDIPGTYAPRTPSRHVWPL